MRAARVLTLATLLCACDCESEEPAERDPSPVSAEDESDEVRPTADPVGSWQPTAEDDAPQGRDGFATAWDGDRWLIWGGHSVDGQFQTYLNGGAILETAQNEWIPIENEGAPAARTRHFIIGTGDQLMMFGGRDGMNPLGDGALYDFDTRTWRTVSPGAPPASDRSAVWTGDRVLVWGGLGSGDAYVGAGFSYDPSSDRWAALSTVNGPGARAGHVAVWTGEKMVVFGGIAAGGHLGTGGVYDPERDSWQALPSQGAPSPRLRHAAAWTGSELLVWGGEAGPGRYLGDGAIWSPSDDEWRPIESDGVLSARSAPIAVWTGDRLAVWGGRGEDGVLGDGALYDPVADRWEPMASEGAPSARTDHHAVWTGSTLVVWGGTDADNGYPDVGGIFTP